jgi:Gram-negative bacterial TonB protein C-terminal
MKITRMFALLSLLCLGAAAQNKQQGNSTQSLMKDEPRLVHADVPMYPLNARISHIIGTVQVQVTIKEGSVVDTTVKSGQPLLAKVTTDNIKSWRFESDVNETFTTKFIYEIEDVRTGPAHNTNPTIEMHLPIFVKIKARAIMVEATTKPSR